MLKTLTILIPSRNRLDLLKLVLKSIEKIQFDDILLSVVVSDNSDIPYQLIQSTLPLRIIRPSTRLPMPQHWEWMISQVKSDYYCILTDRSLLFPKNFTHALSALKTQNLELISYSFAGYGDHYFPYFVGGLGYSNSSNIMKSSLIMQDAHKSHYWAAFPRALNCIFSSCVVTELKSKYGCIFGGVSPDVNFAFKYLSVFEDFIYLDMPVFLSVGVNYSNGRSGLKGENTELMNFALRDSPWQINENNVLPSIASVPFAINYISHEMADVCGLEGFSFEDFYSRIEKEKHKNLSIINNFKYLRKKINRPFTLLKSYEFAMALAANCFNVNELNKNYIFE
jgi:hypothetical protein